MELPLVTTNKRKKLMYVVNAALALAVAAAIAYPFMPLAEPAPPEKPPRVGDGPAGPLQQGAPPLAAYDVIYQRNLRQPLTDRPIVQEEPITKVENTSLKLVLIGTVVEPHNSFAIFSLPGGTIKTIAVGEKIDGAELVSVTTKTATVRHLGKPVTLSIRKEVKS